MARCFSHLPPAFSNLLLVALVLFSSYPITAVDFSALSDPLSGGDTANFHSVAPAIDDSGDVVVFASAATDLVEGDFGPLSDVYIYARETGGLANITQGGNGNSGAPEISPDGRYVVFVSDATNLLDDITLDVNGAMPNVFLYDRQTETTTIGPPIANFQPDATEYIQSSNLFNLDVADEGRVVLLSSVAEEFRPANIPFSRYYLLWYPASDEVVVIEPQAEGSFGNSDLSDDGSFVVFVSSANNLLSQPLLEFGIRLFRYDVQAEASELLVDAGRLDRPAISGDGRHVAFLGVELDGQPSGSTDIPTDLFTLDLQTREILFIRGEGPPNFSLNSQFSSDIDINNDGSKIVFFSGDSNLVAGDTNGANDVFVWDRTSDQITNLTMDGDRFSRNPAINASGDAIVLESAATNLLESTDLNGVLDVLVTREEGVDGPVCELTQSGVLSSSSGVTVNLQGSDECFGRGLFSYGTPNSAGIRIPALPGRPELNLFPQNSSGLPANDLIFFTYSATNGETLYATNFVTRDRAYNVSMTFKSDSPRLFTLFELVVFESDDLDRRRLVYREQGTQWNFTPEDIGNVLNLTVSTFFDFNDDNIRSDEEPVFSSPTTTLFRCGGSDGLVASRSIGEGGTTTYVGLEPGFYQLAVRISSFSRFSSGVFDNFGNLTNVIKVIIADDSGGVTGITDCTDFTGEVTEFGPIGILRQF